MKWLDGIFKDSEKMQQLGMNERDATITILIREIALLKERVNRAEKHLGFKYAEETV